MKGNPEVIAVLNANLANEHAAIQQYSTHAAICENWGYKKLAEYLYQRAQYERDHAKELMDRILFLDGEPNFVAIGETKIADNVVDMFLMDKEAELIAIAGYTEAIDVCIKFKDYGSRKLAEHILEEEDEHLNVIEENMTQITNSGIENYFIVNIEV